MPDDKIEQLKLLLPDDLFEPYESDQTSVNNLCMAAWTFLHRTVEYDGLPEKLDKRQKFELGKMLSFVVKGCSGTFREKYSPMFDGIVISSSKLIADYEDEYNTLLRENEESLMKD